MQNTNLFDNLEDSHEPEIPDLPRLIDFTSFQPQNEQSLGSGNQSLLRDPVSPTIFDLIDQPIFMPDTYPNRFTLLQNFGFTRQPPFNFALFREHGETVWARKQKIAKKKRTIITRKIQKTMECPICLEDIKKNAKIPKISCNHEFHKKCLLSWLQKQQNCPLCRLELCDDE